MNYTPMASDVAFTVFIARCHASVRLEPDKWLVGELKTDNKRNTRESK